MRSGNDSTGTNDSGRFGNKGSAPLRFFFLAAVCFSDDEVVASAWLLPLVSPALSV